MRAKRYIGRLAILALAVSLAFAHATHAQSLLQLECTVRLTTGEPLADIVVAAFESGDGLFTGVGHTAADGTVSFSVPAGTYRMTAFASGADRSLGTLLDATVYGIGVQTPRTVDLDVRRGTTVQTSVVGDGLRALPGARVSVYNELLDQQMLAVADAAGWVRFVA